MIGWKKQIYNSADGISGHRGCRSLITSFITPTNITSICHHCHLDCPDQSGCPWQSTSHQVLYTGQVDTWWRVPNPFNRDNHKVALHKMIVCWVAHATIWRHFLILNEAGGSDSLQRFSLPVLAVSLFKTCYWSTHSNSKFMEEMHLFLWNQLYSSVVGSGAKPYTLFYVRIRRSKFGVASFQTIFQLVKTKGTQRFVKRRQIRMNHSVW